MGRNTVRSLKMLTDQSIVASIPAQLMPASRETTTIWTILQPLPT